MVFTVEKIPSPEQWKRSHSFEEALELVGFGRAQVLLVILSGCSIMASINEAMGLSIILPASRCDLLLDPGESGMVGGAIFLGIMTSSYFWGYQSDTRGRLIVIKCGLIAASICSVASSFANDFASLMALRFITGVFISAPAATVYAYLGEFCTPARRTQMISCASIMAALGVVYVALIGWWMLSYDWSFTISASMEYRPWRLLFILYTLPGFLAAIAYIFCPESPKFQLSKGRHVEALDILKRLYCINHKVKDAEEYKVISLLPETNANHEQSKGRIIDILKSMRDQTVPLFKPPLLKYFFVCCMHSITAFAIYGGLGLWFPQIMNQVTSGSSPDGELICSILEVNKTAETSQPTVCDDHVQQETFIYTIILGCFGACCSLFISLALGKVSGKAMLVFNTVLAGVAGILLQFFSNSYLVAILFCVEIMFAGICVMLVNAAAVSLFPTHVRGMAVSLVNMIGRLSCFVASSVIGIFMAQNCALTFYVLSGVLFVSGGLTFLLPRS
ncbi:synaptic vesicle glycoprotein 2B-like [Topomyia yanbarensis]|uniref:synaptic vesicle glycoprotein 2B-like n=1 Tax=Topomyia yanbarensis TaxID=2498891 RepID=UPI00273C339F|nr:synaptic vesicle glycoprotein 2B-like [Topomyia yanbarensis]